VIISVSEEYITSLKKMAMFFKMFVTTYKTRVSDPEDHNQYLNKVHMVPLLDMMDKRKCWH
jgi:hypothetical protein